MLFPASVANISTLLPNSASSKTYHGGHGIEGEEKRRKKKEEVDGEVDWRWVGSTSFSHVLQDV